MLQPPDGQMPDRYEAMHSVEDYLRTREESRKPLPIRSAQIFGLCFIGLGIVAIVLSRLAGLEGVVLISLSYYFIPLGVGMLLLGVKGGAKYRVTETTRYPQQTGEIVDMYYQTIGDKYLWVAVAAMIIWVLSMLT